MPIKYKFVVGKKSEETALQIDEGKYNEVVFTFGKGGIDERTNDRRLFFDYFILDNEDKVEDNDEFKEVIGDILVDVLENHAEVVGYGDNRDDNSSQSDSQ